jgi:hypothetical protein
VERISGYFDDLIDRNSLAATNLTDDVMSLSLRETVMILSRPGRRRGKRSSRNNRSESTRRRRRGRKKRMSGEYTGRRGEREEKAGRGGKT